MSQCLSYHLPCTSETESSCLRWTSLTPHQATSKENHQNSNQNPPPSTSASRKHSEEHAGNSWRFFSKGSRLEMEFQGVNWPYLHPSALQDEGRT